MASATPTISGYTAREMPQQPSRACGWGHQHRKLRGHNISLLTLTE